MEESRILIHTSSKVNNIKNSSSKIFKIEKIKNKETINKIIKSLNKVIKIKNENIKVDDLLDEMNINKYDFVTINIILI
ncbi:MAG: hypothetical protein PHF86_01175 [Candidatus Nanoarchaeia archaeon]|nr:hypothetical protein [Candidatus Nanoarchaeia archaeon]